MSETYIVTAKTIDEAMAEANRKYSAPGKDVSFTILEMPKKGFLGFGAKEAKVQVTVSDEETISLDSIVAEMKGYKQKTTGGRYGDNERTERPEQSARTERQQRPMTQNPSRNMGDRKPDDHAGKPQRETRKNPEKREDPEKRDSRENPQKQPAAAQNTAQTSGQANTPKNPNRAPQAKKPAVKDAPKTDANVKAENPKTDTQKAGNPATGKATVNPNAPKADRAEKKPEPKLESKPETKPEAQAKPTPEVKPEVKQEGKQENKPAQKSAFKSGESAKPTHTSVVREVNIISNVPLEAADTTETKKYTPKNVEKKRGTNQKAVVREVNILSDIPASDPNASPFRSVPGWDKKAEKQPEIAPTPVEKAETVAAAVEIPIPAMEDVADEIPTAEIAANLSMEEAAGETVETVAAAEDTKFSRHTDDESLSMDELLGALPENMREPDRKKAGITESEMTAAVDFVNTLLRDMQIDATCAPVACPDGEEYEISGDANLYPAVEITGAGSGILIGHHGETLDAIQCLLNMASIRKGGHESGADYVKISLDIENYRAKREETLRSLAKRMAARAVKYKRNVFLEPMNAYERRIIHSELQGVPLVSTHSVGTDKNRKIIITYEGPDKKVQPERNSAPKKRQPEQNQSAGGEESAEKSRRNRKPGGAGEKKERPRPPKPQKLPIESLPDFLTNPADEPIEHLREN